MAQTIEIYNEDAVIVIKDASTGGTIKSITKDGVSVVPGIGELITLQAQKAGQIYSFNYSQVTVPTTFTKEALIGLLEDYLKEVIDASGGLVDVDFSNNIGYNTDAVATTDTGTFSLISLFKRWLSRFTDLVSGTISILVRGQIYDNVSATLTLDVGGETYAAYDVLNEATPTVLTFTNVVPANGDSGYIVGCTASITDVTGAATGVELTVVLYNTAPTPVADGAPFTFDQATTDTDLEGSIECSPLITAGNDSAFSINSNTTRMPFKCASASRNLIGVVYTNGAYVRPAAAHTLRVTLKTARA